MFVTLLLVTFLLAFAVSFAVMKLFSRPLHAIVHRIIDDPIHEAWVRYIKFALMVVGVSAGVRIYELEKYITPLRRVSDDKNEAIQLTTERWILEIYRTVIESLQGIAWMLLLFFVFALIGYVVVRLGEKRSNRLP
ncbi:TPA: hypothetical protein ACFP41_000213 [Neisseria weaveri]